MQCSAMRLTFKFNNSHLCLLFNVAGFCFIPQIDIYLKMRANDELFGAHLLVGRVGRRSSSGNFIGDYVKGSKYRELS